MDQRWDNAKLNFSVSGLSLQLSGSLSWSIIVWNGVMGLFTWLDRGKLFSPLIGVICAKERNRFAPAMMCLDMFWKHHQENQKRKRHVSLIQLIGPILVQEEGLTYDQGLVYALDVEGGSTFSFCGNSNQVIGSDDGEIWVGSGSLSDPLRPSASIMHGIHRRKRQNCGSSSQVHHTTALGSAEHLGLGAMAAEESVNHSGPVFSGVHRGMNQGGRLNPRSLQFNGFEPGNSTSARFSLNDGVPTDASWNARPSGSTLQQPMSNSVGDSTNSSYTYVGDQGRNSYKRKNSIDTYPGPMTHTASFSMGENNFPRYTQGPGARRSDTSFGSICDEPGVRRDGQDAYHSLRTNALPVNHFDGITTTSTWENYYCPSIVQNERAILAPRRMVSRSGTINETVGSFGTNLPETLPLRQGNGLGSWHRHNTYLEEGSNHLETMRNFNSFSDGNYLRQGEALDMIDIDTRPPQLPNRVMRPAHFREYMSQSSRHTHHPAPNPYTYVGAVNINPPPFPAAQPSSRYNNIHTQVVLPPPGSATTMSGMTSGPQAAFGDLSSGNMHGQFLPRYIDTSRALYPSQLSFRGPRALPSDGVNRHRFYASHHELSTQGLPYEWADAYDQHSDMRLDVDNMSYEELLALEERIGNVNTGLDEENIHKCLKMSSYSCSDVTAVGPDPQESDAKCSICQEEYTEGDELGELQCGHGYHTDCIKQWLLLKNQCPICKAAVC